jgi:hypothetical protein
LHGGARRLWTSGSTLRVAAVVAIVVSLVDVLESAAYVFTRSSTFSQFGVDWRFYVEPFIRSLIVLAIVLVGSAMLLRAVARRGDPPPE